MTEPGEFIGPGPLPIDQLLLSQGDNPVTESMSDTGNGERFVWVLGQHVRYVQDTNRWYVWDGQRLRPDPGGERGRVFSLTTHVIHDMRRQAEDAVARGENDEANRWAAFALRSSSLPARKAMMVIGGSLSPVGITTDQLDSDPWLMGVRNGVLNLRTGELRAGSVDDLITKQAAVEYDPEAKCPRWESHVEFMTEGRQHMIDYLRRAAGYTLTGLVNEQAFWFLHGQGNTGKNAFAETLMNLMGEYAAPASAKLLTGRASDHTTELASLRGLRMVLADELEKNMRINEARLKMLAGGTKITARLSRKDDVTFMNRTKLWMLSNPKPQISDASDGIWRRMKSLPFSRVIPAEARMINFQELLQEEWPGILNWCLEGLRLWRDLHLVEGGTGLPDIDEIKADVAEYREEEDHVGRWFDECCEVVAGGEEYMNALYLSYQVWCAREGIDKPLESNWLGRELTPRGIVQSDKRPVVSGRRMRVRVGAQLRPRV